MSSVFTRLDVGEPEDQGPYEAVYRARENDGASTGILSDILRRLTSLEQSLTVAPCQSPVAGDRRSSSAPSHNGILEPPRNNGNNIFAPDIIQEHIPSYHTTQQTTPNIPVLSPDAGSTLVWDDASITKNMASEWVNVFYTLSWGPELPVGKDFFLLLPDLFDLPHVKIDTSALLVYYNVLLQGLFMDRRLGRRRKDYESYMYRKMLLHAKDWDFEAQPTLTDLYAALLLIFTTNFFFERELSWKFHCSAYRIACNLGFLLLDADVSGNCQSPHGHSIHKDQMRFCIWNLVHNDCIFRLHLDKPGLLDPSTMVVKFPELSTWNPNEGLNRSAQINFLVATRLAFAKLRFFDMMDDARQKGSQPSDQLIEDLIGETQTALADWKIDENLGAAEYSNSVWFYDELIQNACTTVILLNRTRSVSNRQASKTQSLEAARRAIESMKQAMTIDSSGSYWPLCYFSFYSVITILTIFANILETNTPAAIAHDMSLAVWFGAMLIQWTAEREELRPVEAAVNTLNDICRQVKLCTSSIQVQPNSQLVTGATPADGIMLSPSSVQTLDCIGIKVQDLVQNPYETILLVERWIYSQRLSSPEI
ncbi:hypothetical protein BDV37DRAFT_285352 [Aspergillus pseudonomiae]|uniref:Transcription factor domain-containing protein n=1 Tax=Aspergillus pseudonomiae TaxID=1506151 RepID=A0A5N7D5W6_9EURO|nr:uncharacterized protein BDV37DRAFT_285352 [Aspergillus pseudonomiae]KAE8401801.1 hypothetical protein BDV37DRAFT_285352 [Aspergillus pseudonomiae]